MRHHTQAYLEFSFFKISCINNTRGFHCGNSIHVYSAPWYHLHYILIPLSIIAPPFQIVFGWFHCAVFICMYENYFHSLYHSVSFPFTLPPSCWFLQDTPRYTFMSHYCHYHHHHRSLSSRFHKWVRTRDKWLWAWLMSLRLFCLFFISLLCEEL
jgi:hypothetical protein